MSTHSRVGVLLLLATLVVARAAGGSMPSRGDGSQTGDGSTPFTGVAQAPDANLFTGGATTSIPIQVPPGRRNLTPNLALTYSSQAGPSPYGHGWSLSIPTIQRSTKHGQLTCRARQLPNYTWEPDEDPQREQFMLSMAGTTIECDRNAQGKCLPRFEEAFLRIQYRSATNDFVVWDKSGTQFTFGEANTAAALASGEPSSFTLPARTGSNPDTDFALLDASDPNNVPRCEYTYSWALTSVEDANGNRMEFRYRLIDGVLYPHYIDYGANTAASGAIPHVFRVHFYWDDRPVGDTPANSSGGFLATLTKRLGHVTIQAEGQLVRQYVATYDDDRPGRRSMLAGMSLVGSEGSVLGRADGLAAAAAFAYRETALTSTSPPVAKGFSSSKQTRTKPALSQQRNALRWSDDGELVRDVFDINGDGFPDLVDVKHGIASCSTPGWAVYFGSQNGFSETLTCWGVPSSTTMDVIRGKPQTSSPFAVRRATLDLTGDGIADFVDARQAPWTVYAGTPNFPGGGWGFVAMPGGWTAPSPGLQATDGGTSPAVVKDLLDMNGDGLLDLVVAGGNTATYWVWYPNTGTEFRPEYQRFVTGIAGLHLAKDDDANGQQYGTFDINGDGLPDHVGAAPGQSGFWEICLNEGRQLAPCENWSIPNLEYNARVRKRLATQSNDTVRDFFDVNADGLPDIVERGAQNSATWKVVFNRGAAFDTQVTTWTVPIFPGQTYPFLRDGSLGGGAVMTDAFDLDGDGLLERVIFNTSGYGTESTTYSVYRLADGAWRVPSDNAASVVENTIGLRPDLLVASESGSGGSSVLRYRPSTQWTNTALPFNIWTLTEVVHRDGLCPPQSLGSDGSCYEPGHEVGSEYVYAGGLFDSVERTFRGFATVQSEVIVSNPAVERPGQLTFFSQAPASSGKITQEWTWDASNGGQMATKPLAARAHTWECATLGGTLLPSCPTAPSTPTWVRLKSTIDTVFSNFSYAGFRQTATVNEEWHSCSGSTFYGNVRHARRGAASGSPQLHTITDYACDPQARIVDRPTHIVVKDNGTNVLEEKWFWYTDAFGEVGLGNVVRTDTLVDVNDTEPAPGCFTTPSKSGGCVTAFTTFNDFGNLESVTDELGRTTHTTYDAYQLYPSVVTHPAPGGQLQPYQVSTTYDRKCGAMLSESIPYNSGSTPPETDSSRRAYDPFCRLWRTWLPGDAVNATPFTEREYEIGAPGYPTVSVTRRREPNNPADVVVEATLGDGLGRVIQTRDQRVVDGALTDVATSTVRYDEQGRARSVSAPFAAGSNPFAYSPAPSGTAETVTTFDALGRATRIDAPGPGYKTFNHTVALQTTTDDECAATGDCVAGRVIEDRDELGRIVEKRHLSAGVLKARTGYIYDAMDRLLSTVQGTSTAWNENTRIVHVYDTRGLRVETRDPDSGTWRYRYDRSGSLIMEDDPEPSRHIQFCYDGMARLTKKQYFPSTSSYIDFCGFNTTVQTSLYYHEVSAYGLGQLYRAVDQSGETLVTEYNVRGQPLITQRIMSGVTAETRYSYDSVGRVHGMRYPDNENVVYGYNATGAPVSLRNFDGGPIYLDGLTYDIFGRPRFITHGNGTVDERHYSTGTDAFRLRQIRAKRGASTVLFDYDYASYTSTGLLEAVSDSSWTTIDPPGLDATASYEYDGLGRMVTSNDRVNSNQSYAHDILGNINQIGSLTLQYSNPAKPHQVTAFGATGSIDHHANGTRRYRYAGGFDDHHYSYDLDDRLRRVALGLGLAGDAAVDFAYDHDGRRTIETRGTIQPNGTLGDTETTRFYTDAYQVTGSTVYKYYVVDGMLIASRRAAAPAWQQASADSGSVQVVGARRGDGLVTLALAPPASAVLAGVGLTLFCACLVAPGRRRVAFGWRIHRGDVLLVALVFLTGSVPVALLPNYAAAQECDPTPSPTPVTQTDIHHYHLDHLGSPQTITTGDGTVVRQVRYDAYGKIRGRWGALSTDNEQDRREFTGYYSEPLSELDYAGARFYDAKLATFLTHDPVRQFANPYAYGPWSPQNGTDPTGTFWGAALLTSEFLLKVAAVGFAAGFAANSIQAAVNGASVGDAVVAGLNGGAAGAISAGVGLLVLKPALAFTLGPVFSGSSELVAELALLAGGLSQTGYALSKGDYTGAIGLGVSIGMGFALAASTPATYSANDIVTTLLPRVTLPEIVVTAPVSIGFVWARLAALALRFVAPLAPLAYNIGAYTVNKPLVRPIVFNQKLHNIVNQNLFKANNKIPGGTAGAIRHTARTGRLIGNTDHIAPGLERVRALENVIDSGQLGFLDRLNATFLRRDLLGALAEAGVRP